MHQRILFSIVALSGLLCGAIWSAPARAVSGYRKATEDDEVVKNKLFPKKEKVELEGPSIGGILNQSYVNTFLVGAGVNYYFSEMWGFGVEGAIALNQDKDARDCIENFYNDFKFNIDDECGSSDNLSAPANFGPAYVPIRETKYILGANAIWSPIYGKQLLFLSATSYFDLFFIFGGGLVISDYYAQQTDLKNGKTSRNKYYDPDQPPAGNNSKPGAEVNEKYAYGIDGRPAPTTESSPMINFGIGQKYHFMKRFHIKAELRNYTLIATQTGFDNFFTLSGGLGVRF